MPNYFKLMKKIILSLSFLIAALITNAQVKFEWTKQFSGPYQNRSNIITTDARGNVYTVGYFKGAVDFDPGIGVCKLENAEGYQEDDIFISKISASGNFIWAKQIRCGQGSIYCIAIDKYENIYCTGNFYDSMDLDPSGVTYNLKSNGRNYGIFILKLNVSGNFVWAKPTGGKGDCASLSIVLDSIGNIYTTGYFEDTSDFNPDPSVKYNLSSYGKRDIFISKLDASGNFIWAKKIGGSLDDVSNEIKINKSGIFIIGHFQGIVDFDPSAATFNLMSSANSYDAYISKLDISGNFVWAKKIGGPELDIGTSLKLDTKGNIYTTGSFGGTVDFDPGAGIFNITSIGTFDFFFSKYDSDGNFIWTKYLGGGVNYPFVLRSIATDSLSNLYLVGEFWDSLDFDPSAASYVLHNSKNSYGLYILKLDAFGNFVWVVSVDGLSSGTSVAIDNLNNVITTGFFDATVDFDPGIGTFNLTSVHKAGRLNDNGETFILKLSQDSCANMAYNIDSIKNRTCGDSTSYASVSAIRGKTPYTYLWNTVPPVKDSIVKFKSAGIYSLTIKDANNCQRNTSIIISEPSSYSGFNLSTSLICDRFRPGRKGSFTAFGINDRCTPVNGSLSVVLDKLVTYNSSSLSPNKISGDTLIWNFSNLTYDSKPLNPNIYLTLDSKANENDSVCFDVTITQTEGDANSFNNKKKYCYPIRNSFDPNIKSVYPQGVCKQNYVLKNKPLTYTVQFQNTGNAEAIDIYILDTLDKNLNINSLRVIGQSHQQPITEILPGRVIKFRFDNINLADSFSDEKASHGYIIFEVMPDSTVSNGTLVNGKAGIYFDFNPPVFTNIVTNTLTKTIPSCSAGTNNPLVIQPIRIYPNPNTGSFTIEIENPANDVSIEIFKLLGKLVKTVETSASKSIYEIDLNSARGMYWVRVKNAGSVWSQKVFVQNF